MSQALGERGRAGLGKRACSLVDLLAAGLIKSGAEKVFIVYQENTWIGELTADGAIVFQGRTLRVRARGRFSPNA